MSLTIIVTILAFVAGILLTWLWTKIKVAGRIADLHSKLEVEKILRSEIEER